MELMQRADPGQSNGLAKGYAIARAGGDELKGCSEAARKAGTEQRCAASMRPAPAR